MAGNVEGGQPISEGIDAIRAVQKAIWTFRQEAEDNKSSDNEVANTLLEKLKKYEDYLGKDVI